jgi:anti-anti-sigma factor
MLRIEQQRGTDGRAVVRLYGRLGGEWVNEVRQVCLTTLATEGRPVRLDLQDVTFIDRSGLALLRELWGDVVILRLSLFAAELLKSVAREP